MFEKGIEAAVRVGVAQFHLGYAPVRMMTMALGSCIGIVLHDPSAGVGALAHAMLPRWERVKNNANRAKFVDTVMWGGQSRRANASRGTGTRNATTTNTATRQSSS